MLRSVYMCSEEGWWSGVGGGGAGTFGPKAHCKGLGAPDTHSPRLTHCYGLGVCQ